VRQPNDPERYSDSAALEAVGERTPTSEQVTSLRSFFELLACWDEVRTQ
jgi:hypothetical protein